ncbi:MAG: ABC transporter ATP-binding protein [Oscillospiraceae bacterium]|nr:ABC transporter ATP-binding protein [Oscillospiraceae bacterium]
MTIKVNNVSKHFGSTKALDNINLEFGEKKIYGLLGNNGAGKSTLLNAITSRLFVSQGEITMDGTPVCDNDWALNQIYMLGEKNYYPETMKVRDAIRWGAVFYPGFDTELAHSLANRFNLPLKKKITALSTGYTTIFKIVMALSTNAPFLLLDEPVLGLDAQHRDIFYKLIIERYSKNPCTIIISTHLIQEVAGLIEHCVIIKDGKIIKDAPSEELLQGGYTISGPASLLDEFISGKDILSVSNLGGLKTACISGEMPEIGSLPTGLEFGKMNLQEYFIQLMCDGNDSGLPLYKEEK